jgi:hypothetical protein
MNNDIFDISFENNGKKYSGWVNASGRIENNGKPTFFHVVLNNTIFGNLFLKECHWIISESRPPALVNKVTGEIEKYYKL